MDEDSPQGHHADQIEKPMRDDAGQDSMGSLVNIAKKHRKEEQWNRLRSVADVSDSEYKRADEYWQPTVR
jgi:hypothetical protein